MANIPVPNGPRAPKNARWFWWIGPAALIVMLYRCIPTSIRSKWCRPGNANSHLALAAILAGGGWSALIRFGIPRRIDDEKFGWLRNISTGIDDRPVPGFVPFWFQKNP